MPNKSLKSIQSDKKAKRQLTNVHFQFEGAHVAYTDESLGGAASGLNEPFLLKAQEDINKELTENQKAILKKINEKSTPLDKSSGEDSLEKASPSKKASGSSSSAEEGVTGEELENPNYKNTEKSTVMDQEDIQKMQNRLDDLEFENKVLKSKNAISGFGFEADVEAGIAKAIASLKDESVEAVIKGFEALKASAEEAKKSADKAKKKVKDAEGNELTKALSEEAGHEEEGKPLSLVEQIKKAQKEQEGVK